MPISTSPPIRQSVLRSTTFDRRRSERGCRYILSRECRKSERQWGTVRCLPRGVSIENTAGQRSGPVGWEGCLRERKHTGSLHYGCNGVDLDATLFRPPPRQHREPAHKPTNRSFPRSLTLQHRLNPRCCSVCSYMHHIRGIAGTLVLACSLSRSSFGGWVGG